MHGPDLMELIGDTQGFMGGAKELGVFAGRVRHLLETEAQTKGKWSAIGQRTWKAAGEVQSTLALTSMDFALGTNYQNELLPILGFKSVGIWLPRSHDEFKYNIDEFAGSALFKGSAWEKWIRALYEF
jgi:hypothetical protein